MKEVLLIEHDRGLSDGIFLGLLQEPYRVTQSFSAEEALAQIRRKWFSMVILDENVGKTKAGSRPHPDETGTEGGEFSLLSQIRRISKVPVLVLTEQKLETEQLARLGADCCVVKPFSLEQLREKMRWLRKQQRKQRNSEYRFKSLSFQPENGKVFKDTEEVRLNSSEKRLLHVLMKNKGIVLSETALMQMAWNRSEIAGSGSELTMTIRSLRSKLEDNPDRPELIRSVRGDGYVFFIPEAG